MTLLAPSRPDTSAARITPEDLLRMPDNSTYELVDGRIVEKNVSLLSSNTEGKFYGRFDRFLESTPVAEVYPASLGYRCFPDDPDRVRKPDTTIVRIERVRAMANPNPGHMPIVPDLAVEVVSTNDMVREVDEKVREYLEAGFPLIWVANPIPRSITVYPNGGRPAIFTADDEITAEATLPGFRCRVAEFFPAKRL